MYGIQKDGDIQQIAGNSHIVADDALSTTSENPIQNKVVTNALADVVTAANEAETSTTTPRDADLLGGHAPSYFATTDSLNGKLDVAKIDKGTISLPSVSKGNYGTIDVNFNHSFSSSPKVMLTLYSSQGNIHRVYLQVSVSTITQNGFTVAYAYDGSATLGTTSVNWVAIG